MNKKGGRFSGLLKKDRATEADDPVQAPEPLATPERRGPGRPPGKRSNPDYQTVTTFLHKQTYQNVQKAIIGTDQDFGDVVDELLKGWLNRNA